MAQDAPCFVGLSNADFQPVFVNAYGRRMVGLANDADISVLSVADFFPDEDRAAIRDLVLPSLRRHGVWQGEYRFHHFGGGEGVSLKWRAFLLRAAMGVAIGAACFATELTGPLAAEVQLRESRTRLKAAADLAGLSSYQWNPQTGALRWDDRLKALWGLPPGVEPTEALWMEGVHPDDRERAQMAVDRALDPDGDGVYALEYRVIGLQGGAERWISTHGQTQFEGRDPVGFTGAALDITGQKQVEAQLRRSEAYLATILRQLPVGVGVFDIDGRRVLSNPAAERFDLDVMPSRNPRGPERWQGFRADGSPLPIPEYPGVRALRGETTAPGTDFLHTLANGDQIWVRVGAAPLREADGPIQGIVSIIEDVDQQRRNDARLRESEARFQSFAENASDVLWILSADQQRLEYLSPSFKQAWGVAPEAAIADIEVWRDCIHPEDRVARTQTLQRVVTQGEAITHRYRIVRPDGSVRRNRDTAFPIRDHEGRIGQIGGTAHDISGRDPFSVYVVGADTGAREAKLRILREAGRQVTTFATEAAFLDVAGALAPGCVFVRTDDAVSARFGLASDLKARGLNLPVIFETALGDDVALAIGAMKAGAVDVLQTPAENAVMLAAVSAALANLREEQGDARADETARRQVALMTRRELEVLEGLLAGGTNKTIARALGISPRTVEIHRARVMERLGAHTVPEAIVAATAAGLRPARRPPAEA